MNEKSTAARQPVKTEAVLEIEQRYLEIEYNLQLDAEMKLLHESFMEVQKHKQRMELVYSRIAVLYKEAVMVYESDELEPERKRRLLCRIYNAYFSELAPLPFKIRRHIHADKYIKRMERCIKGMGQGNAELRYWIKFAKVCGPPFIIGMLGEYFFLEYFLSNRNPLISVISLIAFITGFSIYFISVYNTNGERLYSVLQKWLVYKIRPGEQDRPGGLIQYIKMLIPLAVAVVSALAKVYIQS